MHIHNRDPKWVVALYPWTVVAFMAVSLRILFVA